MAQKIINVGTSENSGDGDPLRLAFTKVNDNFTEVYGKLTVLEDGTVAQVQDTQGSIFGDDSTLLVDAINSKIVGPIENKSTAVFTGTVDFAGATVNNLTIQNYIGDLKGSVVGDDSTVIIDGVSSSVNLDGTVKGDIIPDTNVAYDIGSATKRFKDLYLSGNTINLGGTALSVVAGKLQVGGTDVGAEYTDSDVDTHLNTSTASSGEVLSWTGSDYDWVAQSGGDLVSDTTPQLGGDLDTNGNDIIFQDSDHLFLGTDSDLDFYHDGSNARLHNSKGFLDIVIGTDSMAISGAGPGLAGSTLARFFVGGGVELRHQNNVKLDTVSYGISITGLAKLSVLTSAPTSPADGMVAIADGSGWDPMTNGVQTMVVYLNGAWREIANAT